jgi:hypothetical protein
VLCGAWVVYGWCYVVGGWWPWLLCGVIGGGVGCNGWPIGFMEI